MDTSVLFESLLKYLPDLLECLSRMPDERRARIMLLLRNERGRSLLFRMLQQVRNDADFRALVDEFHS